MCFAKVHVRPEGQPGCMGSHHTWKAAFQEVGIPAVQESVHQHGLTWLVSCQ